MCSTSSRRAFFDAADRIAVDTLTESKSGAASIVQTRSMPRDAPTALLRATRERERKKDDGDYVTGVARASTFRDEGDRYGGVNNDRKSGI